MPTRVRLALLEFDLNFSQGRSIISAINLSFILRTFTQFYSLMPVFKASFTKVMRSSILDISVLLIWMAVHCFKTLAFTHAQTRSIQLKGLEQGGYQSILNLGSIISLESFALWQGWLSQSNQGLVSLNSGLMWSLLRVSINFLKATPSVVLSSVKKPPFLTQFPTAPIIYKESYDLNLLTVKPRSLFFGTGISIGLHFYPHALYCTFH